MEHQDPIYCGDAGLVGLTIFEGLKAPHIRAALWHENCARIDKQLENQGYPRTAQDNIETIYLRQDVVKMSANEYPIMQNTSKPWRLPTLREAFEILYLAEIVRRNMGPEEFAESPLKAFQNQTRYWTQPIIEDGKTVPVIAYAGMNPETFGFEVGVMQGDKAAEEPAGQIFVLDQIIMNSE